MTRDEIIRMFHEAGEAAGCKPGVGNALVINYLAHFAALAAAAEREACVRLCESGPERRESNGVWVVDHFSCAEAIRARGQQ